MRKLERTYSKSERIIARARFSAWAFLREILLAAILGGAIAALWIFAGDIEGALDPNYSGAPKYLSPDNLKWALLAAGLLVALIAVMHAISLYFREIIVTEDKFLYRSGVGNTVSVMLPLSEIRYIDVRQGPCSHCWATAKSRSSPTARNPLSSTTSSAPRDSRAG